MPSHTPGVARVSGWAPRAPRAQGSGREAYQTGARVRPSLALKRSRVWRLVTLGVGAVDVWTVARWSALVWCCFVMMKKKIRKYK